MFNIKGANTRIILSRSLVTDQDYRFLTKKVNTTGPAFDAVEGLGVITGTSTIIQINAGGWDDQRISATMKYISPTTFTGSNEDIGVMLRVQSNDSPSVHYYYARASGTNARITRVLSGSFVNLSSTTFALSQSQLCEITFQIVGNQLSASFIPLSGASPSPVYLTATDSTIPSGGCFGFRSQNSTFYCRSFVIEEL